MVGSPAARAFRTVRHDEPGVVSLALVGELDMAEAPALELALQAIEAEAPEVLLVDLSRLELVDSHGLTALVGASRRAETAAHRLLFVPPPEPIMQVLRITLLDRRLTWVDDAESLDTALTAALRRLHARAAQPSA